jgi:hypothetical protein
MRLRLILANQTVRLRGGWHRLRIVPTTGFLISSSQPVGPAASSDPCKGLHRSWRQGTIKTTWPSDLRLDISILIGCIDTFLVQFCS